MRIINIRFIFCTILALGLNQYTSAQEIEKKEEIKVSLKDTLDNKLDLSDFIINKKGFVPMPILITEPSLGGFGGGVAPIFIKQNKPIEYNGQLVPVAPDMTMAMAAASLNGTWLLAGGHGGQISKWGLKYMIGGGYGNINMNYYFNLNKLNRDAEFEFNIRTIPIFASLTKPLKNPRFSIGAQYMFTNNKVKIKNSNEYSNESLQQLADKIGDYISKRVSGNVAKLGAKFTYDSRDNTFTPNRGVKASLSADWSNPVVGSDYKYGQFKGAVMSYLPIKDNLITGSRFVIQQIAGNEPFYLSPFVDMRGVPAARYAGNTTVALELEERWDFTKRWSIVAFGGGGKAFDKFDEFGDSEWAWGYGAGFRYLMARKLNLRMGVDLANGSEGFTYYLVFGSVWMR